MIAFHSRPCAAPGLKSYRARGPYGFIMIGAKDDADALAQARLSNGGVMAADLEVWIAGRYVPLAFAGCGVITLPNRRRVSLGAYARAWRSLKMLPPAFMAAGFYDAPAPAAEILAEMRRGLHERINWRGGLEVHESRAHPASYGRARTPRVRIEPNEGARFSPAARRALAHRIHSFAA